MTSNEKGYLGNNLLKRKGQVVNWTPDQVTEFVKCANDPVYFAEKYIKIVHVDHGLISMKMYDYQKEIVEKMFNNRRLAVLTARQAGKALALDTAIPMADGTWSTMGDLKVGDKIVGSRGQPVTVTFKSEVHHKPTYRIAFSESRETVDACEDHLWTVYDGYTRKYVERSTKQLAETYHNVTGKGYNSFRYSIQTISPVIGNAIDLPIDPYVLGAWLGDGSTASNTFTCHIDHKSHFESQGMTFTSEQSYERSSSNTVFTSGIAGTRTALREQSLLGSKRIPTMYLSASVDQRERLLQGLMDTDGFVSPNGTCHIQLSDKTAELLDDIYQLLIGLGFKVTVGKHPGTASTRLSFNPSGSQISPVTIPHKLERVRLQSARSRYIMSRSIKSIKLIPTVPTQCITVDAADHLFAVTKDFILTHNTTTAVAIILHFIIFNEFKNVGILSNKGDGSKEVLERIKLAYESLPKWMQHGIEEWNKNSIELENGCKVYAGTTSSSSIRGKSIAFLYIDECAFVEGYEEFFASVYPTISSGDTTKLLMTSTPNGLNHFHKICLGAIEKTNGYEYVEVTWDLVPGRGVKWKQETLEALNFDYQKFSQEYECQFLGSSGTLIDGATLKILRHKTPLHENAGLTVYEGPQKGHTYVVIVDVSRGKGLDYSAFQLIDVSQMPYKQVAVFRDSWITPTDYADFIFRTAKSYNDAYTLVEVNDIGGQVADTLHYDFESDSLLYTESAGKQGKRIASGLGKGVERGIRTTKSVKSVGCSILKLLVEQGQLQITDHDTINELSTFSRKGASYEAEPGCHDDLVMGLVLFAWLSTQMFFKDITDINTMMRLRQKTEEEMSED